MPIVLAGSDFVFSGFGSIQRYDNMFGPSNFNAEDIDDFLAKHARTWGVDGGLRTVPASEIGKLRRYAVQACRAVYQHLGLADFTDAHAERAVDAAGSKDLGETDTLAVLGAAQAIREGGLTVVDIVAALDETGYEAEAEAIMAMTRARLSGDYLQTAAIFDEELRVLSLVTDPNDYASPGTGYEPSAPRQAEIDEIRQARGVEDLRAEQASAAQLLLAPVGPVFPGQDPRDVVIGVIPAVGRDVWRSLSGLTVPEVLGELLAGLEEEGCTGRVVRFNDTVDLGRIGLAAARLRQLGHRYRPAGQGHRADPPPGPRAAGQPGAVLGGPGRHPRAVPAARRQRRPARQGRDPRPGPQPLHRRGHRGPLPHDGDRADGAGTGLGASRGTRGAAVEGGAAVTAAARRPASGVQALSGRPVGELTLEAVRRGEITLPDLRIHPEYAGAPAPGGAGARQPAAGGQPAPRRGADRAGR